MYEMRLNENFMEDVRYITDSLPVWYCYDNYDLLINHEIPFHWHKELEFLIVLNGKLECVSIHENGTKVTSVISKGSGVFFNTKALHNMKSLAPNTESKNLSFADLFFNFQPLGTIYKNSVLPVLQSNQPGVFFSPDDPIESELLKRLFDFFASDVSQDDWELHCIETICYAWRCLLKILPLSNDDLTVSPNSKVRQNRMWAMLSFIHDNYEKGITINDICNAANISKSECFRCFRDVIDQTPIDYLKDYRLSRAASRLIETDDPIAEIGFDSGFNNSSYFGSQFKKKFGISPKEYRAQFNATKFIYNSHAKDI